MSGPVPGLATRLRRCRYSRWMTRGGGIPPACSTCVAGDMNLLDRVAMRYQRANSRQPRGGQFRPSVRACYRVLAMAYVGVRPMRPLPIRQSHRGRFVTFMLRAGPVAVEMPLADRTAPGLPDSCVSHCHTTRAAPLPASRPSCAPWRAHRRRGTACAGAS